MKEQLNELIDKLNLEFSELGTAVQHIKNADLLSNSIIDQTKDLPNKFQEVISSIEALVKNDFLKIYNDLEMANQDIISKINEVNFQANFSQLIAKNDSLESNFKDFTSTSFNNLNETLNQLKENLISLKSYIENLEIKDRLADIIEKTDLLKIEVNTVITDSFQKLTIHQKDFEKSIELKLQEQSNEIFNKLSLQSTELKNIKYIGYSVVGLVFIVILILIAKS